MYVRKGYFLSVEDFIRFHSTLYEMKVQIKNKREFIEILALNYVDM